jgi:putative ABC transport system permease protein
MFVKSFWRDVRYALRMLVRNHSLTAIVALSLGLGIGLNTAVFSFVDAVLLHPFPYSQPDRLVLIWGTKNLDVRRGLSGEQLERWQSQSRTMEKIAPFQLNLFPVSLGSEETDTIQAAYVGTDLLSILGTRPLLGRTFSALDEQPGGDKSAILSYGLWQSRFGGDPHVVGTTTRINRDLYTVQGVMPSSFFFPDQNAQLWLPLTKHGDYYDQVHGLGQLRRGATLAQAQLEVDGFVRDGAKETGQATKQQAAGVFSLYEVVVGKYQVALWTLLGAVTLLVLLACANISNLLLARGVAREREFAVRLAMGAKRGNIFSQLMTESVVLTLFAGLAGLLFGFWGIRLIRKFRLVDVTGIEHAGINLRVMFSSFGLSVFAGLVSGVMPAWRSSRKNLHPSLQQGAAGTAGRRHGELRDMLISLEVAIALVLLVSAGLLVNSFVRLTRTSWGFNPDHLLLVETKQPTTVIKNLDLQATITEGVLQRFNRLPGIESSAMAYGVPLRYYYKGNQLAVNGVAVHNFFTAMWTVSHDYFRTMGIPLLRGREFSVADSAAAQRSIVISKGIAERLWPGQNPIGKTVNFLGPRPDLMERWIKMDRARDPKLGKELSNPSAWVNDGPSYVVVGEVGNVRMFGLESQDTFNGETALDLYVDYRQQPGWNASGPELKFLLRTTNLPQSAITSAKQAIDDVQPGATLDQIVPMQDLVSKSIGGRGSNKLLLVISILFGSLSLFLAAAGIYGVVSHSIVQRTREIGIRMALGADARDIVRLVMMQGMRPVLWGASLGLVACWAITRFFKALMFGITPTDPLTFSIVSALLLLVSLCACLIPSIRTMNTNPVEALRHD